MARVLTMLVIPSEAEGPLGAPRARDSRGQASVPCPRGPSASLGMTAFESRRSLAKPPGGTSTSRTGSSHASCADGRTKNAENAEEQRGRRMGDASPFSAPPRPLRFRQKVAWRGALRYSSASSSPWSASVSSSEPSSFSSAVANMRWRLAAGSGAMVIATFLPCMRGSIST